MLAQRLPTIDPEVWAVPGHKHVCLVERNANDELGLACTRTRDAVSRSAYTASVPSPRNSGSRKRVIIGLVANGVTGVLIRTAATRPVRVPVNENFFMLEDAHKRPPESVQLIR